MEHTSRLDQLGDAIRELKTRLDALDAAPSGAVTFHVETFAPEPYSVKRPIPIVVQHRGDSYTASFVDANVSSSGDTQHEAYANAKELVLDLYDKLTSLPETRLGPGPRRQLAVLKEYVNGPDDHEATRGKDR